MSKEVNEERAPRTVTDVKEMLTKHSNGEIQRTIQNCITILQNDHVLADAIRMNLLSERILYMTKPLKAELLAWLEKLKQDEQNAPEKYSNCGQLFRLSDGLPIAPELLTKWYRLWRAEHPEFEQIVFHGLRHSSATYQLLQSDGDFKSVQGNTGHATASVLMDTYAHTQDKPRLELTEKIEANFYSQDLTPAAPQPRQNEKPVATKISGKEILEAIRLMDADERRELTRALFA